MKIGVQQRMGQIMLVELETGRPLTNVAAWIWGKGSVVNPPLANSTLGGEEKVIRSWPESSEETGHLMFDTQLYDEKDYIIIAVPCSEMEIVD